MRRFLLIRCKSILVQNIIELPCTVVPATGNEALAILHSLCIYHCASARILSKDDLNYTCDLVQ